MKGGRKDKRQHFFYFYFSIKKKKFHSFALIQQTEIKTSKQAELPTCDRARRLGGKGATINSQ